MRAVVGVWAVQEVFIQGWTLRKGEYALLASTKYVRAALDAGVLTTQRPAGRPRPLSLRVQTAQAEPAPERTTEPAIEGQPVASTDDEPVLVSDEHAPRRRRRNRDGGAATDDHQQRAAEPADVRESSPDVPEGLPGAQSAD